MPGHPGEAAHAIADPVAHQAEDVDREHRRRVGPRPGLHEGAVVEHRGQVVLRTLEEILANDDGGHTGDAGILLGTGVDQPVPRDVDRPREEVARAVAHQRGRPEIGIVLPLHALDGLVARDVHVCRLRRQRDFAVRRQPVVVGGSAVPGDVHLALAAGLLRAGRTPGTGDHVVGGGRLAPEEVHGNHRKLQACAPLQKHHLVGVADAEQTLHRRERLLEDPVEGGAAVTDLQDRHSDPGKRQHLVAGPFEHLERQNGRPGREVEDAIRHGMHRKILGIPGAE